LTSAGITVILKEVNERVEMVYEFDQCEACKADGKRCTAEGQDYLRNPGAPMGFLLCGTHLRSGERLIARDGGLPRTWGKYNFYRGIL
jgi:hypothetical protein